MIISSITFAIYTQRFASLVHQILKGLLSYSMRLSRPLARQYAVDALHFVGNLFQDYFVLKCHTSGHSGLDRFKEDLYWKRQVFQKLIVHIICFVSRFHFKHYDLFFQLPQYLRALYYPIHSLLSNVSIGTSRVMKNKAVL